MDNRIFNVNGSGGEQLMDAIKLAFKTSGFKTAKAWKIDNQKGIILYWYNDKGTNPFPSPLTAEEVLPIVSSFLKSEDAKNIECIEWDEDYKHDGSNSLGWRVYTEKWGKIDNKDYSFLAIKPAYMWHGK